MNTNQPIQSQISVLSDPGMTLQFSITIAWAPEPKKRTSSDVTEKLHLNNEIPVQLELWISGANALSLALFYFTALEFQKTASFLDDLCGVQGLISSLHFKNLEVKFLCISHY